MNFQISRADILNFASTCGTRTRERGSELVFQYCPYCHGGNHHDEWTFSINTDTGKFCCQRSGCGEHGGFGKLCKDFGYHSRDDSELQKQRNRLEADYVYRDLDGQEVLRKRKWRKPDGSKVFQWQYMEAGRWRSGANKIKMLYGLPSLRSKPSVVYLTEGEKDADTVTEKFDLPCLSLPDGAKKTLTWRESYNQFFSGKTVYILSDNDEIGQIYAKLLASKIASLADTKVYLLNLPKAWPEIPLKGDISDMVAAIGAGEAKRRLEDLISSTEPWTPDDNLKSEDVFDSFGFYSVPELSEEEKKPPDFIIDGILPCGMSFLSGAPKTRKSFLALQLAIAVARGQPFFGKQTSACDVVYLDLEGSKSRISSRASRMTSEIPSNVYVTNRISVKLSDGLVDMLRDLHRERPSIRLVIIDTYSRARGQPRGGGANAYDQDVSFLEPIQQMALDENIAILFIHHDRKGAGLMSDSFERLSGTMGISGSADCVMNLITDGKRFEGKATLEITPRDAAGCELKLCFDQRFGEWTQVIESASDLLGNPVCNWLLANRPDAKREGVFYPYDFIYSQAYRAYSEKPSEVVREQIMKYRDELFSSYLIGVQLGVKSNGNRGIRLVNLA